MAQKDSYDDGKYVEASRGPLGNAYEQVRVGAAKLGRRISGDRS